MKPMCKIDIRLTSAEKHAGLDIRKEPDLTQQLGAGRSQNYAS